MCDQDNTKTCLCELCSGRLTILGSQGKMIKCPLCGGSGILKAKETVPVDNEIDNNIKKIITEKRGYDNLQSVIEQENKEIYEKNNEEEIIRSRIVSDIANKKIVRAKNK